MKFKYSKFLAVLFFFFVSATYADNKKIELGFLYKCYVTDRQLQKCPKEDLGYWWTVSENEWKKVKVSARKTVWGGEPGEELYISEGSSDTGMLVRGIDENKPKKIVFSGKRYLHFPFAIEYKPNIGSEKYLLQSVKEGNGFRFYLKRVDSKSGAIEEPVFVDDSVDLDFPSSLLWFGDIDGDGKPDVLFSMGYNCGTGYLFELSGAAKPGELLGNAARVDRGCM